MEYGADEMGDFIEPIAALRLWRYNPQTGMLHGCASQEPWVPGFKLRARCITWGPLGATPRGQPCGEPVPNIRHGCGIYGMKSVESTADIVRYYSRDGVVPDTIVGGKVYLWGSMLEGSYGYRAEFGYPAAFTNVFSDPRYGELAKMAAGLYQVPYVEASELVKGVEEWGKKRSLTEWTK